MADKTIDSTTLHDITEKEKALTGETGPVKGGPTAQAQKHVREEISGQAVSDITKGEKKVTGEAEQVKDGPAALAQSILSGNAPTTTTTAGTASGDLDPATISRVTDAEKKITGQDDPAQGGPTAQAQKHAGEHIGSENLHDITEGEKLVTGEARPVKGGPTATVQSELSKSRS